MSRSRAPYSIKKACVYYFNDRDSRSHIYTLLILVVCAIVAVGVAAWFLFTALRTGVGCAAHGSSDSAALAVAVRRQVPAKKSIIH